VTNGVTHDHIGAALAGDRRLRDARDGQITLHFSVIDLLSEALKLKIALGNIRHPLASLIVY
jgi:hypothetical protein